MKTDNGFLEYQEHLGKECIKHKCFYCRQEDESLELEHKYRRRGYKIYDEDY